MTKKGKLTVQKCFNSFVNVGNKKVSSFKKGDEISMRFGFPSRTMTRCLYNTLVWHTKATICKGLSGF